MMSKTNTAIDLGKLDPRLRPQRGREPRDQPSVGPTSERSKFGRFTPVVTYEREADGERQAIRTVRDLNASVAKRLSRCKLTAGQLMAATLFERDHETGRLEARVTVNLLGTGGGKKGDPVKAVLLARERKHNALNALRLGGPDVVRVVEDVVLNANTVVQVGKSRHANKDKALAWAGMALSAGLHLLESHYRLDGRMTN